MPAQRVTVIPAKAGIHLRPTPWTPVFTGVTNQMTSHDRHSRESNPLPHPLDSVDSGQG